MSLRADWFTQLEEPRQIAASSPAPLDSPGRLLALDLGAKRIGVAVSDELRVTTRPLPLILRRSWKDLLQQVAGLVQSFAANSALKAAGLNESESRRQVDSEAAAIILRDFIDRNKS